MRVFPQRRSFDVVVAVAVVVAAVVVVAVVLDALDSSQDYQGKPTTTQSLSRLLRE